MDASESQDNPVFKLDIFEIARVMADDPNDDPTLPEDFGPYHFLGLIGSGSLGDVWLAAEEGAERRVAIKILRNSSRPDLAANEVKTHAQLEHKYIARLYSYNLDSDQAHWLAMEYVEGVPLTDYCDQHHSSIDQRLRLFREICEGVRYAHVERATDHGDLKPSNILINQNGEPKLIDFGLSRRLSQTDTSSEQAVLGFSPAYAAPEIVRGQSSRFRSDVYSLGVILYELLCGEQPFDASQHSFLDLESIKFGERKPERPSDILKRRLGSGTVSHAAGKTRWSDLDALCLKAMDYDIESRYSTVDSLLSDLDRYAQCEPLIARMPHTQTYRWARFFERNKRASVVTATVLLFVCGLVTFFALRLKGERDRAIAEATRTRRIQAFMLDLFQGGDKEAGPTEDLRVTSLIDRGTRQAASLESEPAVQVDLYQTLGLMYQKLGRFDQADSLLHSAIKKSYSAPGIEKSSVAENLIDLSLVQSDEGKFNDAERTVIEAIETIHRIDPTDEHLMARAESVRGQILVGEGQSSRALAVLNSALALQAKGDSSSADLAETLDVTADAKVYLGDYQGAGELYSQALALHRQIYGDNHPAVAEDLRNVAQLEELQGHYSDAERDERRALDIVQKWYGNDHPATALKMTTLASTLLYEMKDASDPRYLEARHLLDAALAIQERVYGIESSKTAYVLNSLGAAALYGHDYPAAEDYFQRLAAIYKTLYSEKDYRYAIALANLASVYQNQKRYKDAEGLLRQALGINLASLGPDNVNTAIDHIKLGRVLLHEGRYREAAPETRSGFDSLIKQTTPNIYFIQGASKDLTIAYGKLNEPQKLEEIRTIAAMLKKQPLK